MYLYIVSVCLLFCVFVYELRVRSSRLYKGVKQYPACFTELPVVGPFYRFVCNSEDLLSALVELANTTAKLGGISRLIGLNNCFMVLTDATDAAEVLKHCLDKDNIYKFLQPISGAASVFNTEYAVSKVRRQAFLPSYTPEKLSIYTDSMWRQSVRLTEALAPYVGQGPFRIEHILGGFCFDNIIGAADVEELTDEYSSAQMCFNYVSCLRLVVHRWTSLWMQTDLLHRLSSNYREMDKLLASLHTYVYRAQEIRRNKLANFTSQQTKHYDAGDNEKLKPGLFDNLINSKLSKKEIAEEIAIMFAASDECGLAIFFTLKLLAMYPSVQDKAFEELQNVFADSNRPFVKEDSTRTPYLDMVIKESLRIFSIVPFILRKAHTDTKLPSGRVIPAGAGIGIAIYSVLRDPKYWGPDAAHFDPERFLLERLASVPDIAYKPFSFGPRSCPGYKFAQNIIKIGLCAILRRYKVVGTPAAGPVPRVATKYEIAQRPIDDHIELVNRS